MKFVSTRKIDELGRVVLPIEIRHFYGLGDGDRVDIRGTEVDIVISKATEDSSSVKMIDKLGRLVIPKEFRDRLHIKEKDSLAVEPQEDGIHVYPAAANPNRIPRMPEKKNSKNADIYEKDYTANRRKYREVTSKTGSDELLGQIAEAGIFEEIRRKIRDLPHVVNPIGKAAYEKALEMLDVWAMFHSGKVCGVVSYDEWDAYITVTFPFFEFFGDTMETLQFLSTAAYSMLFEVTPFGEIQLTARFEYFEDIGDKDRMIGDILAAHPDIVEEMVASADRERDAILADPQMSAVLASGAEQAGATPREYLERLEQMVDEKPEEFLKLLYKSF